LGSELATICQALPAGDLLFLARVLVDERLDSGPDELETEGMI
jgi:hypothetical protein